MIFTLKYLFGSVHVSKEAAEFAVALDRNLQSPVMRRRIGPICATMKGSAAILDRLEKHLGPSGADRFIEEHFPIPKS